MAGMAANVCAKTAAKAMTDLRTCTGPAIQFVGQEYQRILTAQKKVDNLCAMLEKQTESYGQSISLLEHGLQTATRAYDNGENSETVVCALLHDIGEDIACPSGHGEIVASMLRPYISRKNFWILNNHEVFQGYYYLHHFDLDRERRKIWKDHEFFDDCAKFCELYDAPSFDPNFKSQPLEFFKPMIEEVVNQPLYWDYDDSEPKRGLVSGN